MEDFMNRITIFLCVSFFISSSLLIGMESRQDNPPDYISLNVQGEQHSSFPAEDGRVVIAIMAPQEVVRQRGCALKSLCCALAGEGVLGFVVGASLPLVHFNREHKLIFGNASAFRLGDDFMSLAWVPMSLYSLYGLLVMYCARNCRLSLTVNNCQAASLVVGAASGLAAAASEMIVSKAMHCPLIAINNSSSPLFEQCESLGNTIELAGLGSIVAVMGSVTVIIGNIASVPVGERWPFIKKVLFRTAAAIGVGSLASAFVNNVLL